MNPMISLVISSTLGAMNWTFAIAWVVRMRLAPGTRGRYICATIGWTMAPFITVQPLWMAINDAPKWFWIFVTLGNYWGVYDLYRDDDDNFWKRKKKQFKSWVRSVSRKPITVGAQS